MTSPPSPTHAPPLRKENEIDEDLLHLSSTITSLQHQQKELQSRRDVLLRELEHITTELKSVEQSLSEYTNKRTTLERELQETKQESERQTRLQSIQSAREKCILQVKECIQPCIEAVDREYSSNHHDYESELMSNIQQYLDESEHLIQIMTMYLRHEKDGLEKAKEHLQQVESEISILKTLHLSHNLQSMEREREREVASVHSYSEKVEFMMSELRVLESKFVHVVSRIADYHPIK